MAVPGLYACRCVVSALTTFVSDDLLIMFDGAPLPAFSARKPSWLVMTRCSSFFIVRLNEPSLPETRLLSKMNPVASGFEPFTILIF